VATQPLDEWLPTTKSGLSPPHGVGFFYISPLTTFFDGYSSNPVGSLSFAIGFLRGFAKEYPLPGIVKGAEPICINLARRSD